MEEADVSYETGSAIVTFDPALTNPDAFIAELTRLTGFTAEVGEGRAPMDEAEETHIHDSTHVHN